MTISKKITSTKKEIKDCEVAIKSFTSLQKQLKTKKANFTFERTPFPIKNIPMMKKEVEESLKFWRNYKKELAAELRKLQKIKSKKR